MYELLLHEECPIRRKDLVRVPLWEVMVLSVRGSPAKDP